MEIIHFNKFKQIKPDFYKYLYNLLPWSRKVKVDKLFNEDSKKIAIIEYFLVKKLLKFKKNIDFSYFTNGKPYVVGYKHFNISHSKNMLVVASCDQEIGIDVQYVRDCSDKFIRSVCNDTEYEKIMNSENKNEEFIKLWTKKESYIKLNDGTIFCDLTKVLDEATDVDFKFKKINDYIVCVCTKKLI